MSISGEAPMVPDNKTTKDSKKTANKEFVLRHLHDASAFLRATTGQLQSAANISDEWAIELNETLSNVAELSFNIDAFICDIE